MQFTDNSATKMLLCLRIRNFLKRESVHKMSKILAVLVICIAAASCGGQSRLPVDSPTPRSTPSPMPSPTPMLPPVVIQAADVLNMGMIGQTWLYQNGYGEVSTFTIEAVQTLSRTNADGTVTDVTWTDAQMFAAGRGGNNLVIHMTKTVARAYWNMFAPQAEIWFLLHQNPDGSWRSTGSIIDLPHGCGWCGANGQPSTAALIVTSDVVDNQPGMALPYIIAPPTTTSQDHFVFETRVGATWNTGKLTFDNMISPGTLVGPADGEYWRTDFYQTFISTPVYTGLAIVSDQYEGQCGHERWYFAPADAAQGFGGGIVKIESPYDGGQVKNDQMCILYYGLPNNVHDPNLTIVRTQ